MTKIKICGLSRFEDIAFVNELRPDYVGFVFAKSKRQVSMALARELINKLSKNIKTVGVFVNEDISVVQNIADTLKLEVLQFHGKEDKQYIDNFQDFEVWKAVGVSLEQENIDLRVEIEGNQRKINELAEFSIGGILLDSSVKGISGGTGLSFNWELIESLKINKPLILAGGLNAYNVEAAIAKVKPSIVDVSGGVEENGVKSYEKIKEFIDKVRKLI